MLNYAGVTYPRNLVFIGVYLAVNKGIMNAVISSERKNIVGILANVIVIITHIST